MRTDKFFDILYLQTAFLQTFNNIFMYLDFMTNTERFLNTSYLAFKTCDYSKCDGMI